LGTINSEQLAKQLQESQTLLEISQMLAGAIDLDIILQQIADAATALIKSASRTILHLRRFRQLPSGFGGVGTGSTKGEDAAKLQAGRGNSRYCT
jgi:hypothetical protein